MPLSWLGAGEFFGPSFYLGGEFIGPKFQSLGQYMAVGEGAGAHVIVPFQWEGGAKIEAVWYKLSVMFYGNAATAGASGKGGSLGLDLFVTGNKSHVASSQHTDAATQLNEQAGTGPTEFETWKWSYEERFVVNHEDQVLESADPTTGKIIVAKSFVGYANVRDGDFQLLGQIAGNPTGDPVVRTLASLSGLRPNQDKTLIAESGVHPVFSQNHIDQFGVEARVSDVDYGCILKLYQVGVQWRSI